MVNLDMFLEKSKEIHGNKYDYSKVSFSKVTDKVCIICPVHGEFWQEARQHYRGQGCPKCAVEKRTEKKQYTTESFIEKVKKIHGDKYDYSKVNYVDSKTKVCIICPEHGEFWQIPNSHQQGEGCPECKKTVLKEKLSLTTSKFIEKSKEIHGDKYDYSNVNYVNQKEKVCIVCPEHGEFWQNPFSHYNGNGCPECAKINKKITKTTEQFIIDANKVHHNYYDYSKVKYVNANTLVNILCPLHGEFQQKPVNHLSGCGCQKCAMIKSHYEDELANYITSLINKPIERDNRTILKDLKQSIDIYIPYYKIAIEFDGLYWHNEINKPDKKYHLKKTEECLKQGIQLIHIFEDEWVYKKYIVISRLRNLFSLNENKIYARKCKIRIIENNVAKEFCKQNHLQGAVNANICLGLFFNDELVSVMTFGKLRKNLGNTNSKDCYELLRFCNKKNTTVIGGASKLFKHFVNEYEPKKIISYADRRWSNGKLYETLNFKLTHTSQPNYFYVFGDTRKNRFNFRKDILISKYGCKPEMTEHEFCLSKKWYRIYDCGTLVYERKFF